MAFVSGFTGMPVTARVSKAVCRTRMALEGGKSSGGGMLLSQLYCGPLGSVPAYQRCCRSIDVSASGGGSAATSRSY